MSGPALRVRKAPGEQRRSGRLAVAGVAALTAALAACGSPAGGTASGISAPGTGAGGGGSSAGRTAGPSVPRPPSAGPSASVHARGAAPSAVPTRPPGSLLRPPSAAPRPGTAPHTVPRTAAPLPRATAQPSRTLPVPAPGGRGSLAGRTVLLDPGHNGGNASHPAEINRLVDAGGFRKECDTTGAETDAGYPEYAFTLDVAERVAAVLRAQGARVVLTRNDSSGVGPCIDERAALGNLVHADAALSIHADGGPEGAPGFHVIEPGTSPDGGDAGILAPSARLAVDLRAAYAAGTGEPYAGYVNGGTGLIRRSDLGGLDLSRVPKVFIECANLRDAADATRVVQAAWRQRAADAIAAGLTSYLRSTG